MKRLLVLIMCCLLAVPVVTMGQKKGKSIDKLKSGLKDINKSKRDTQKKLGKTKANIVDVKKQMGIIEDRMQKISSDIESTADQLTKEQARQVKLKEDYEKASAGVKAKRIQVEKRIRSMYMEGKPNVLEFVLGSKSSADLSTREFIATRVQVADRKLFTDYQVVRDEVKKKKLEQDDVVRNVAALRRQQQLKQEEMSSAQKQKESYLHGLEDKKEDLQGVLDELDSDAAAIEGEIRAAMARARAEEKRRAAEEKRKASEAKKKGVPYVAPVVPKHTGGFVRPTGGPVTSGFGSRYHPILHYTRMHSGMDFGGGYGAAVFSAGSGRVIAASTRGGYGNCVIIDHGNGMSTVYGHLSRIMVSEGQAVGSHQRIGSIGSSGLATGPHLHFEIRINGRAVNPARYL